MNYLSFCRLCFIVAALVSGAEFAIPIAVAQDFGSELEVRIEAGQTVRDLAGRYLGNADLWPEILKASKIATVADISEGDVLRIPVDAITTADTAIAQSGKQIIKAN